MYTIGSFFINNFNDITNNNSSHELLKLLSLLNLDILGLRGVYDTNELEFISEELKYYFIYNNSTAIFSRYPIYNITKNSNTQYVSGLITFPNNFIIHITNIDLDTLKNKQLLTSIYSTIKPYFDHHSFILGNCTESLLTTYFDVQLKDTYRIAKTKHGLLNELNNNNILTNSKLLIDQYHTVISYPHISTNNLVFIKFDLKNILVN